MPRLEGLTKFFSNIILLKEIFLFSLFPLSSSLHNSFTNECGPYIGIADGSKLPTVSECIDDISTPASGSLCCHVSGEQNLETLSACFIIENLSEKRINVVGEMEEVATGIKIDCGLTKSFENTCGLGKPDKPEDCTKVKLDGSNHCCFVSIESEIFTGKACRSFDNLQSRTIGEAVVAAKTIDAKLDVNCIGKFLYKEIFLWIFCVFFIL